MRQFFESRTDWKIGDEAADGSEAIQKATKLKPDLILLDYCMPKMNGIEAASVLRQKLPDTRIVVFTLYDDALGSRVSSAVGVDLIVSKADGLNNLVKSVHEMAETLH
jgi:DNA-binding NarL/FixJ family response regulator